jgi:hypothetical protein
MGIGNELILAACSHNEGLLLGRRSAPGTNFFAPPFSSRSATTELHTHRVTPCHGRFGAPFESIPTEKTIGFPQPRLNSPNGAMAANVHWQRRHNRRGKPLTFKTRGKTIYWIL